MAGVKLTKLGYPVKTDSDNCISEIDDYYDKVLSYGKGRESICDAANSDKSCVLANVLASHILHSSNPDLSYMYLNNATENIGKATAYEKAVYDAVAYSMLTVKDYDMAISLYIELLQNWPRDLASLKRAQTLCIQNDQADRYLDIVEQVKADNKDTSYFNGMRASALLEVGRLEEAKAAATVSLLKNDKDFLAQHCIGYILQKQCHFGKAVVVMKPFSQQWESCNSYMYTHNWCLVAACYLEAGAYEFFYETYENHIIKDWENVEKEEVYVNILGLLTRYYLHEHMLGLKERPRIQTDFFELVLSLLSKDTRYAETQLDLLLTWALTAVLEMVVAQSQMTELHERAKKFVSAIHGHGSCKEEFISMLGSDFKAKHFKKVIGASDEQLQVFKDIWYCALVDCEDTQMAIGAIKRGLKEREVPFLWRILEVIYLRLAENGTSTTEIENATLLHKDAAEKAQLLEKFHSLRFLMLKDFGGS